MLAAVCREAGGFTRSRLLREASSSMPAWQLFSLSYEFLRFPHSGTSVVVLWEAGRPPLRLMFGACLVDLFGIAAHPFLLPLSCFQKVEDHGIKAANAPEKVLLLVVIPFSSDHFV